MIGRLIAMGAAVAAAAAGAGAAVWAKRKAEEDAALEQGMRDAVVEQVEVSPMDEQSSIPVAAGDASAETVAAGGDDLTSVKGIGAIIAGRLHSMNVTTFSQLASWSDEDIERIGAEIKISPERIRHEDWVGQAQTLTAA